MNYVYYQLKLIAKLEDIQNGINMKHHDALKYRKIQRRHYNCKLNYQSHDANYYVCKSERQLIRQLKYDILMNIKQSKYAEYSVANHFERLPVEILDRILTYCAHIDMVSLGEAYPKYLNQIMNPIHWKYLRVCLNSTLFYDKEIHGLIQYLSGNLREISFKEHFIDDLEIKLDRRLHHIEFDAFKCYFTLTSNLVSLELCTISFSTSVLIDGIVQLLLKLEHISFGHNKICDDELIKLKKLKNLNSIDLSWSFGYTNNGIFELISSMRKLVYLSVQSEIDGLISLESNTIEFILKYHSSTLKGLRINGSSLTDDSFKELDQCTSLNILSIKRGTHFSSDFYEQINRLHSLQSLSLIKFNNLYLNLFDFGTNLSCLKQLSFEGCRINDETLINLPKCCPVLEELVLNHAFGITTCGFYSIITECTELRLLDLTFCNNLDFILFQYVPNIYLAKLKVIILNYCNEIVDYDFYFSQLIASDKVTIIKNF